MTSLSDKLHDQLNGLTTEEKLELLNHKCGRALESWNHFVDDTAVTIEIIWSYLEGSHHAIPQQEVHQWQARYRHEWGEKLIQKVRNHGAQYLQVYDGFDNELKTLWDGKGLADLSPDHAILSTKTLTLVVKVAQQTTFQDAHERLHRQVDSRLANSQSKRVEIRPRDVQQVLQDLDPDRAASSDHSEPEASNTVTERRKRKRKATPERAFRMTRQSMSGVAPSTRDPSPADPATPREDQYVTESPEIEMSRKKPRSLSWHSSPALHDSSPSRSIRSQPSLGDLIGGPIHPPIRNSPNKEDSISSHMFPGNEEDHPKTDENGTEIHQPSPGHGEEDPTTEQDDTEMRQLPPTSESDEDELTTLPHEYHGLSTIGEESENRATPASPSPPKKHTPPLPRPFSRNSTTPIIHLEVALENIKPDGCHIVDSSFGSDPQVTNPPHQEEKMLWSTLHCQDHWSFLMFNLETATITTYSPLSLKDENDIFNGVQEVMLHLERLEKYKTLAWTVVNEWYDTHIKDLDSSVFVFIGALYSVAKLPVPSEIDDLAWKSLFRCFFDENPQPAQPDIRQGFRPLLNVTDARDLNFVVISTDIEAHSNDLVMAKGQARRAQEQVEIVQTTTNVIIPQRMRNQVTIREQIQQNEAERDALTAMKETLINNSAIITTRTRVGAHIESSVNEIIATLERLHHELDGVAKVARRWSTAQSLARKFDEVAREKLKIVEYALRGCVKRSEDYLEAQRAAMEKAKKLVVKAKGYLEQNTNSECNT